MIKMRIPIIIFTGNNSTFFTYVILWSIYRMQNQIYVLYHRGGVAHKISETLGTVSL